MKKNKEPINFKVQGRKEHLAFCVLLKKTYEVL